MRLLLLAEKARDAPGPNDIAPFQVFEKSAGFICVRRKGISELTPIVCSTASVTLNLLPGSFCRRKGVSYIDPPSSDLFGEWLCLPIVANVCIPRDWFGVKLEWPRLGREMRATEFLGAFYLKNSLLVIVELLKVM